MENNETMKEISLLQQNMANLSAQKQQFTAQVSEYENALKTLDKTEEAYKIIGNIMVKSSKEELKQDLKKKIDVTEIRIKSFEKQENKLKEKLENLQKEAMSDLQNKKD